MSVLQRNSSDKQGWLFRAKLERARQKSAIKKQRALYQRSFEFRGSNLAIQSDTYPEILLCGGAGTGKTLAVLNKIHNLAWEYAGARILIVRKVKADLAQSTLVTFERDVLGEDNPICANVQREYRKVYKYPNGSEIVVGGMDRPGRILSAEYDIIYPAEAIEFTLLDWEMFIERNRSTVVPFQQIIADTNPDRPDHWLKQRADAGVVKLYNSFHEDNPKYYDADAETWTKAGEDYVLGKLERLTGVRKQRKRWNKWVQAEGAVYDEYNEAIHVIEEDALPKFVRRWRSIDFGFKHAFVCQWWGEDHDGRIYLYRELYHTELTVFDAAVLILRLQAGLSEEDVEQLRIKYKGYRDGNERVMRELNHLAESRERIYQTISDHDAEDRETLRKNGINTEAAKKSVKAGIDTVKEMLKVDASDKPSIFFVRGARVLRDEKLHEAGKPTSTLDELPGYVWDDKNKKEHPIKDDDHGMDAMRYMVMALQNSSTGTVTRKAKINYGRRNPNRRDMRR